MKHTPNLSPLCLQYLTIPVRLYNCPSITNIYSLFVTHYMHKVGRVKVDWTDTLAIIRIRPAWPLAVGAVSTLYHLDQWDTGDRTQGDRKMGDRETGDRETGDRETVLTNGPKFKLWTLTTAYPLRRCALVYSIQYC